MKLVSCLRVLLVGTVALGIGSSDAWAQPDPSCRGANIANGPFTYAPQELGSKTFVGLDGDAWNGGFTVTAPGDAGDTAFPAQSGGPCPATASAEIRVFGIEKVGDENGEPLETPLGIDLSSPLGGQIAAAFFIFPSSHLFEIAQVLNVGVTVTNPMVSSADYGDYIVTIKAQAIGAGIGTGSGTRFALSLRAPSVTDSTPPDVTVTKPAGDEILGVIAIETTATDPTPGSGVNSLTASISSAGGVVSNLPITLGLDQVLPVAAGVTVTGTGAFVPTGGTGPAGTTEASAFTAASRSGIGSYTVNAAATDVAGNTGTASKTFAVKYAVEFTKASNTSPNCATNGNANCQGQFHFTVNRSSVTSDGAFMFDKTVRVDLLNAATDAIVATHYYGTGDVKDDVQIGLEGADYQYKAHFKRGDLGATTATSYKLRVSFLNVDGVWMEQATSAAVTF